MATHITRDVDLAVETLRKGGIVAIPTETVYGLAALALDETAVGRVFSAKGRPRDHPLIVHLAPSADPSLWGVLDDNALSLAAAFWPGPLTILVPRTALVPDWVTGGRSTVALRVPSHPTAVTLLERLGDALVAPSANTFGRVSPTTARHVADDLGDTIDLVLDGGPCDVGVESTIVECTHDGLQILRPGAVTRDDVERVTGVEVGALTGGARAPGMLASHYAPRAAVEVVDNLTAARDRANEIDARGGKARLVAHDDPSDYARHLYADMRAADDEGATVVVAVDPGDEGLGPAVRDRLLRAAAR